MKLALASDLHLEFGDIEHQRLRNAEQADVLVLSGDICLARDLVKKNENHGYVMEFWKMINAEWAQVIYIMGNHEHYHGYFAKTPEIIKDALSGFGNIHFLDKQKITLGGVHFLAGSLWTDFNKANPLTLQLAKDAMNDYKYIKDKNGRGFKLWPKTTLQDHNECMAFFRDEMKRIGPTEPVVIVGHHAPSVKSSRPEYDNDIHMNALYFSALEDFMLDNPNIKIWTHGHIHYGFDYKIGATRVVSNPRGYIGLEFEALDWGLKYFEVS